MTTTPVKDFCDNTVEETSEPNEEREKDIFPQTTGSSSDVDSRAESISTHSTLSTMQNLAKQSPDKGGVSNETGDEDLPHGIPGKSTDVICSAEQSPIRSRPPTTRKCEKNFQKSFDISNKTQVDDVSQVAAGSSTDADTNMGHLSRSRASSEEDTEFWCLRVSPVKNTQDKSVSCQDCEYCGKLFDRLSFLEIHERVHTGEKPFVCDICNKSFTTWTKQKAHKRKHTEEK